MATHTTNLVLIVKPKKYIWVCKRKPQKGFKHIIWSKAILVQVSDHLSNHQIIVWLVGAIKRLLQILNRSLNT